MTIRPDIQFGLNVTRSFTEIANPDEAVENIGLNLDDLEIIRDAASEGEVSREDVRCLSQLNVPLQRFTTKLRRDVQQYSGIVNDAAGIRQKLRGNLLVNGIIAASSIKYLYLEEGTNQIKSADVSTSRVSSWSSPDSPPDDTSPIFYGGDLQIGGKITTNDLNLFNDAEPVRFRDSEVPTHAIQATINGQSVLLYAMKGIPLTFDAFFRNWDTTINLVDRGAVSIRIIDLEQSFLTRDFENLGGANTLSANLIFRDTRNSQKRIEIFHDPRNIRTLDLNRLGIDKLPAAELSQLEELRINRNVIREFPNLTEFAPNLTFLDIRENLFGQSDDPTLRQFDQTITDRMPTTIENLFIGNTFDGSITGDLRARFPNLKRFDCTSHTRGGARPRFTADNLDPDGFLPEVADTVTDYRANDNRFESLPNSVKQLPELERFDIRNNRVTDRNFFIDSPEIRFVRTSGANTINVADMSGKQNLDEYRSRRLGSRARSGADPNAFTTPQGNYKFANCANLRRINFRSSRYRGPLPKFQGNGRLDFVDLFNTEIRGGLSDSEQDFVIYPEVFDDCRDTIRFFRIRSSLLISAPIHPDAFVDCENMDYLYIRSNNRGVTGNIPDLTSMPRLRRLYLLDNNLTGQLPTFSQNPRIDLVHVRRNNLSGAVPAINQSRLRFLFLHDNNFTEFFGLDTPNLRRLYLRNNSITGSIPDLSNLTLLQDLFINSNNFESYTRGSIVPCRRLRRIDISNNSSITEGDINIFIDDLVKNYENNPRSRVTVNIRNTATPTGIAQEQIQFLNDNGWTIRT